MSRNSNRRFLDEANGMYKRYWHTEILDGGEDAEDVEKNEADYDDGNTDKIETKTLYKIVHKRFAKLCVLLQQNAWNVTKVEAVNVDGFGIPLGLALTGNTKVQTLEVALIHKKVYGFIGRKTTGIDVGDLDRIAPLLQYVRDGPVLSTLDIRSGILAYTRAFVVAAAQNPALRVLTLDDGAEVPLAETAGLLRTTHHLQSIVMPLVNSTAVAKAFGANRSLERILFLYDPGASPPPNGVCLSKLGAHPRLCALRISYKSKNANHNTALVDGALSGYLKETKRLEELELDNFTFNEGRMQHLLKGLSVNRSLVKLQLEGCVFCEGALRAAQSFASRATTERGFTMASIRELTVESSTGTVDQKVLASLVVGCRRLQAFDWTCQASDRTGEFWQTLKPDSERVTVEVLKVNPTPQEDDYVDMVECIGDMPYLSELCIGSNSGTTDTTFNPRPAASA